jgi:hypothetical protein
MEARVSAANKNAAARSQRLPQLNFDAINRAALAALPSLLARWLPDGVAHGAEYIARNPRRADRRPGSFSINLRTGPWADFATADAGRRSQPCRIPLKDRASRGRPCPASSPVGPVPANDTAKPATSDAGDVRHES